MLQAWPSCMVHMRGSRLKSLPGPVAKHCGTARMRVLMASTQPVEHMEAAASVEAVVTLLMSKTAVMPVVWK